jgi:ribosomal protein S18 acetylase RimI-like enzyme
MNNSWKKGRKSMKKQIALEEGTIVCIEPLTGREDIREFQRFINQLTKERTYLLVKKPITLTEEKQWFHTQVREQRKGQHLYLKAVVDGRLVGDCCAKPGFGRNQGNINLGIAIAKKWRGKGIGHLLLEELILRAEKKWHPKNFYLHVVVENKNALKLYQSLGFQIIARLPEWFEYNNKYLDEYLLLLNKERFPHYQKGLKKSTYSGTKKR